MASQLAVLTTMYSTSVELNATDASFLLNQDITHKHKLKQQHEVFFLAPTSSFLYPVKINKPI
jgi:hypothetical protein